MSDNPLKTPCDACGKLRVLVAIDSGQQICRACYKLLKPSRSKELATYATLEAFARRGIELPDETTRVRAEELRGHAGELRFLFISVGIALVGVEWWNAPVAHDRLDDAAISLLVTDPTAGLRLLAVQRRRRELGEAAWAEADRTQGHQGVVFDGVTDRMINWWELQPPPDRREVAFVDAHLRSFLGSEWPTTDPGRGPASPPPMPPILNKFDLEVVGESHYQAAIERAAGGRTFEGVKVVADADLIFEDDNPHDRNAVAVLIGGLRVGYLQRDDARSVRRAASAHLSLRRLRTKALIVGGWDRGDGDAGHFGVRLDANATGSV